MDSAWVYYSCAVLLVLACGSAWLTTLVTLPGNWFIAGLAAIFAWLIPTESGSGNGVTWTTVAVLIGLALVGEIIEFGARSTKALIEALALDAGCRGTITQRMKDGAPFRTDGGNLVLDCAFERIEDPEALAAALEMIPGVVEHGLFLGVCDLAILAGPDGVELLAADEAP